MRLYKSAAGSMVFSLMLALCLGIDPQAATKQVMDKGIREYIYLRGVSDRFDNDEY